MAAGTIGIGIIGCGRAAETLHVPAIGRAGQARVVALCDVDRIALDRVAGAARLDRRYGEPARLFADPLVDAVAICTPPVTHAALALEALRAGKHVMVEKPLTLDPGEGAAMCAAARGSGVTTAAGLNLRCHRLVEEARSLIRSGALGEVRLVRSSWTAGFGRDRRLPDWRRDPSTGGGVLSELATHHADLWRHLLDTEIADVAVASAGGGVPEDEAVTLAARTVRGALVTGTFAEGVVDGNDVEVVGSGGRLTFSLYRGDSLTLHRRGSMHGAGARVSGVARRGRAVARSAASTRHGGDFLDSYRREWQRFASAVLTGQPVAATWDDGLLAVRIVDAARRSLASGRREEVARG